MRPCLDHKFLKKPLKFAMKIIQPSRILNFLFCFWLIHQPLKTGRGVDNLFEKLHPYVFSIEFKKR